MLTVNLVSTENYSEAQKIRLQSVFRLIESAINSQAFKDQVLGFRTDGELTFSYRKHLFASFPKFTNQQVFDKIMAAAENIGNVSAGAMDLYLVLEPGSDGQNLGFGYDTEKEIHTYSDYFNGASDSGLANHLTHEWCHKLGFQHAKLRFFDSNRDKCSVPYAIGNLVQDLSENGQ